MKKIYIISVCVITALSSCTKDAGDDRELVPIKVFTCTGDTRTALGSDGITINWSAADKVSVFDNFGQNNCLTASTSGSSSTTFEGNVSKGSTQLYAIYPYAASASIGGTSITTTLPSVQTAVAGSIPANTNIAVASATKGPTESEVTMNFRNACMFVRLALPALISLKKVSFSSLDGTLLSGTVSVNAASDEPVATVVEGVDSVALAGPFSTNGYYYLVLPAVTLNGFALTLDFGDFSVTGTSTAKITAARGKIWDMSPADFLGSAEASIVHNYMDETLVGSTMTLTTSFDGISPDWTANIYDNRGTLVRTASGTGAATVETVPVSGKPYLPKTLGPYSIELSYNTENGSTLSKSSVASVAAPAPEFSVSINDASEMYTSYDKYEAGNVSGANSLSGRIIYGIKAFATISNDVLSQLNAAVYCKTDDVLVVSGVSKENLKSSAVSTNSYGEFYAASLPTGERTVQVAYLFDGVKVYSEGVKKITSGIPMTYDFTPESARAGSDWVTNKARHIFNSGEVRCGYILRYYYKVTNSDETCNIFTNPYYTSDGTKVTYSATMGAAKSGLQASKEGDIYCYVGITSSTTTPAKSKLGITEENSRALSSSTFKTITFGEKNVVMPNNNRVSFSVNHSYTQWAQEHWVILRNFTIKYEAK